MSAGFDDEKFAALICDWCLEPEPGQRILISAETIAEPAVAALQAALLARGAWPFARLSIAGETERVLEHGRELHLESFNPLDGVLTEAADAFLRIEAPSNTRAQSGGDPERLARLGRQGAALRRLRRGKRWALTIWPTPALAQEADMGPAAYARFLARALHLDRADPVSAWRDLGARQQALVERLTGAREVRIQGERTDLRLDVSGRVWINSDGRRNMPSGEVFTSPLESSASGRIRFDVPSLHGGSRVSGVELVLVDGVVTRARADQGDARLAAELAVDAGARRLGEIGIGTNYGIDRATGSTLLDEKIGGTVHLALGRSYPECGGANESAIHWDLICDLRGGGEIAVDGEVLSRDGRLL